MDFNLTSDEFGEINLVKEQAKNPDIQKVLRWIETYSLPFLQ